MLSHLDSDYLMQKEQMGLAQRLWQLVCLSQHL